MLNGHALDPTEIKFTNVVNGGDHGKAKFRISVKLIVNALAFLDFHPRLIAAYICEILYLMGHANVAGISSTSGFPMQKLRQGGPDGPFIFDVVFRYLTLQVYQAWGREGVFRFLFDDGSIDG